MKINALDAHCHADLLMYYEPLFHDRYRDLKCGAITWSYLEKIDSWKSYPQYWDKLGRLCRSFGCEESPFFYLVGIHPRSIAEDLQGFSSLPEQITDSLSAHLKDPLCLGLGELGLDAGTRLEEKILRLQLDWALENLPGSKRIGIHTPRHDKVRITRETLSLLEDYVPLHARVLVDHVTPETWSFFQNNSYMVGMTLQDGKTSVEAFLQFVHTHRDIMHRIILNSDGARGLSMPFLQLLDEPNLLDGALRRMVFLENALRFYDLSLQE